MQRILNLPVTMESLSFQLSLFNPVKLQSSDDNIVAVKIDYEERENLLPSNSTQFCQTGGNYGCFQICLVLLPLIWRLFAAMGEVVTDSSLPTLVATVDLRSDELITQNIFIIFQLSLIVL